MTAICSDWLVGSFASAALVPSSQRHLREERGLGMAQFQSGHSRVAVLAEAGVADRRLGRPKAGIFRAGTLPMRQRLILTRKTGGRSMAWRIIGAVRSAGVWAFGFQRLIAAAGRRAVRFWNECAVCAPIAILTVRPSGVAVARLWSVLSKDSRPARVVIQGLRLGGDLDSEATFTHGVDPALDESYESLGARASLAIGSRPPAKRGGLACANTRKSSEHST